MTISITDAVQQTSWVAGALLLALIFSARPANKNSIFPIELTNELKGLAILMIVFSHVGYFLVSDHRFLVPLSNYAGVGVDLFLALSGYGLAVSALRKPLSIGKFYLKRLPRVYLPVIVTLAIFLLLDFFILHRAYPVSTTLQNFLGLFPHADLYNDIDSPLWFITFLLVNYFLFPIIFQRRYPIISAVGLALTVWLFIILVPKLNLISVDLVKFYKLHFLAFPLGVMLAGIINQPPALLKLAIKKLNTKLSLRHLTMFLSALLLVLAGATLAFTYTHSFVGHEWTAEALSSVATVVAILIIFILKPIDFKILALFGVFSFEIYLLHWPIFWRYNFLFGHLPAGIAMLIYLGMFVGLGYLYKKVITKIWA